jgi:exodeoxyribonuclease VII small subunit
MRRGKGMAKEKFEDMLGKLEEIVKRMETGEMSLEESLKAFEEGIKLSRLCAARLDDAQRRIDILSKQGEELVVAPFQEGEEGQ